MEHLYRDRTAAIRGGLSDASTYGDHLVLGRPATPGPLAHEITHVLRQRTSATDPSYVVNWVRAHQAAGGRPADVMDALSTAHGGDTNRCFYTGTYGWVDIRHFGAAAALAARRGVVTETAGFAKLSRAAGAEFGGDY